MQGGPPTTRGGVPVSDTASATCSIVTTSGISVTEVCPITAGISGGLSSFSGVVSNSGNITLSNVVVVSDRAYPFGRLVPLRRDGRRWLFDLDSNGMSRDGAVSRGTSRPRRRRR